MSWFPQQWLAHAFLARWRSLVPFGVLLLFPRLAAAQGAAVLPDLAAPPELAEQAAAVSMLFRSYLKAGERKPIPRHELALAIEAFTGRTPRAALVVPTELAGRLADQLGADRIVIAELSQSGKRLMANGLILGPSGKRMARLSITAALGELSTLAHMIAQRVAPAIGAEVVEKASVGLADLRPFVNAQTGMLAGDTQMTARSLEVALPNTASRLPAALDLLRSLADEPGLPAATRVQARLLMNDWGAAVELVDQALAGEPKNVSLRAAKLRAKAALRDFAAADAEAAQLKAQRSLPAVAVALAVLAIERGDPVAKRDEALAPLVGRSASEWRIALPLLAAYPPGTFGPTIEHAALAAAQKLAAQEPGLAALVATRALAGGASVSQAAPLINVQDLSGEQVKAVSAQLEKAGGTDQMTASLSQEIRARQEESAKIEAMESRPEKPTGPPSTLAVNLRPLLQKLDPLYEPSLTTISIAPLPGSGQPFYWPFLVRRERLAEGLLEGLMRQPWELQASRSRVRVDDLPPERATEDALAVMARDMGGEAVLMYRLRPAGLAPWVNVELILFDVAKQKVHHASSPLIGRSTGLVIINPVIAGLCILLVLGTVVWAVVISFRGSIVVRVQWDPDSKEELFSILISHNNKTPVIDNPAAYKKKLEWFGQRKRRFEAWHVERSTTFRGIPKGKYFVHLYGLYTRGRQVLVLNEPYEIAEVQPRKTAFVAFNLEASEADFKITVVDDNGTVEGARVWLDKETRKAGTTTKDSPVTLKVPKGYHVIHVAAKGIEVERPYQVVKAKVHEMTINLVWERRQEYASRALERQVDDALPYLTASHKPQGRNQPSSGGTQLPSRRGTPASSDAIEIPLAGSPVGSQAGSIQGPLTRPSQPSQAAGAPQPAAPPLPVRAAAPAPVAARPAPQSAPAPAPVATRPARPSAPAPAPVAAPRPVAPTPSAVPAPAPTQQPPTGPAPSPGAINLEGLALQAGPAPRPSPGNRPAQSTAPRPGVNRTAAPPQPTEAPIDLVPPGPRRTR
jgi:hypothetical protein